MCQMKSEGFRAGKWEPPKAETDIAVLDDEEDSNEK